MRFFATKIILLISRGTKFLNVNLNSFLNVSKSDNDTVASITSSQLDKSKGTKHTLLRVRLE